MVGRAGSSHRDLEAPNICRRTPGLTAATAFESVPFTEGHAGRYNHVSPYVKI